MAKTILITDMETPLGHELVQHALSLQYSVITTCQPGSDLSSRKKTKASGTDKKERSANPFIIPWNKRSPISARTVVLESLNSYDGIDSALILFSPRGENRPIHEIPVATIAEYLDNSLKANLFLTKEILSIFQTTGRGNLSFVVNNEGTDILTPLDASLLGGFKSLAQSSFAMYQNEPLTINGFESDSTSLSEYAAFILRSLGRKSPRASGRWLKFSGKMSRFFQALMPGKRR